MHWKFDPFFSIDILHAKYPPLAVGQAAPPAPVFQLTPTSNTQQRLRHLGWVFKPNVAGGGGTLFAEKSIGQDGTAKLRANPAPNEGFSFIIRLTDAALLSVTKPYDAVPTTLPAFSGRARMLYFDNQNPTLTSANTYTLTAGASVGIPEFGSRMPTQFMFRPEAAGVTQVAMSPLKPGGSPIPFDVNPHTRGVEIQLPESGYKLTQQPGNQSEILFLTDETLPPDTIGVVSIFKPAGADWEPKRRYQIFFDKAS